MMGLSTVVFVGSAALVGGVKALVRGRPNLAQALATPAPSDLEIASAEALECQTHLNLSVAALGFALAGRYFTPLPVSLAATPLIVYLQWPALKTAQAGIVERRSLKNDGLAAIAISGGWLIGTYASSAFALTAYWLSRKTSLHTGEKSRQKLLRLFDRQPQNVWCLVDGVEIETPLQAMRAGDNVVVYAGESIPVDGIAVSGRATVDQSRFTGGEGQPAEIRAGDRVFATAPVLNGWLHVRVEGIGQDTLAMQAADILGKTMSYPMAIRQRGLKLADDCVLPGIALSVAALPLQGASSALSVFFARPGGDMLYAAPLSLLNFLHASANCGIIVKDAGALERMRGIDTLVFGQVGSLTLEQPEVAAVHACGTFDRWQVLACAAVAAHQQSQTAAQAILEEARHTGVKQPETGRLRWKDNCGAQTVIDGQSVRVGSLSFVGKEGLALPPPVEEARVQAEGMGHSWVFVAVGEALAGAVELRPALRPGAQEAVARLKLQGIKPVLASAGAIEPIRHLAQRLQIDEYFPAVMPKDEAGLIRRLQQEGRSVCYLGDGLHDDDAMKSSQVSVSLHTAARIDQEAAQIVLMGQGIRQLPLLFDLSKRLDVNLATSFKMSVATGTGIIGGIFLFGGGIGTMALAQCCATMAIIGNAVRPLPVKVKKAY